MTDEMKANDATRYAIVNLNSGGVISYAESEGEAVRIAKNKATDGKGDEEYAVFQKIGSARLVPQVEWKGAAR